MGAQQWRRPERDGAYEATQARCRSIGLNLLSARSQGEAIRRGADYWVTDRCTGSVIFEADLLPDVRKWLRLEDSQ